MPRLRAALVVCCFVLAFPSSAKAQVLYGSIVGNVKDPSGGAVINATVTITHKQTNQSRQAVTNESGAYAFSTVPSGSYSVTMTAAGFTAFAAEQVVVMTNNVTRVDATLKVGAVSEVVQVTAEAATLQTDRPDVRAEITSSDLENIPMAVDRNYQGLFVTIPGFSPPDQAHSVPSNPSRAMTFNVNGVSRSSNNTCIDGASGTNVWLPHMTSYVPAAEAIEAVNVVTNSFDAEIGLAGGAAINVQIKSGTNARHGSAFLYHNDAAENAKLWITPAGQRSPKKIHNQFGGTLGGPIKRDKLFFFASFESNVERLHDARIATIPTMAIRQGDMSASSRPVYDPLSGELDGSLRLPFPGNIVPGSRIDPVAQKIVKLFPAPTFPDLTENYYASAPYRFDRNALDTKINWTASPKLSTYARVSRMGFSTHNKQYFGDELGGPPIHGGNPGSGFGYTWSTTLAATYVATTRLVIDAYFGWKIGR